MCWEILLAWAELWWHRLCPLVFALVLPSHRTMGQLSPSWMGRTRWPHPPGLLMLLWSCFKTWNKRFTAGLATLSPIWIFSSPDGPILNYLALERLTKVWSWRAVVVANQPLQNALGFAKLPSPLFLYISCKDPFLCCSLLISSLRWGLGSAEGDELETLQDEVNFGGDATGDPIGVDTRPLAA